MIYNFNHKNKGLLIQSSLDDLKRIIEYRIKSHFDRQPVNFSAWLSQNFSDFFNDPEIFKELDDLDSKNEILILLIGLVPHIQPNFFEPIIQEYMPNGGDFPEFGGIKGNNYRSMLPTGETVQFILAGTDWDERLKVMQYFEEDHFFYRKNILWLEPVKEGEPKMSGRIILAQDWVDKILLNKESIPRFGLDFPAKRITTEMNWDDLVLDNQTAKQVGDITIWLQHHHLLLEDENLKRKIKPGYRVLFYGSSGTGKTLTATLVGKAFKKDVYRIDLSQVVSKYIGETEKNLESVFRRAESKDWILFFDEADALFGKRTNVQNSNDKYANQEVSYLLQRVEDYPGLLILASNLKNNLDEAFLRRFHGMIHFPLPNAGERLMLWQRSMPANLPPDPSLNLKDLATKYELSGASILNAVQYATLKSYEAKSDFISKEFILEGIRSEFMKEEKTMQ